MSGKIKAIFFDFDGVIIDSETVHGKAKRLVLEKYNIPHAETIFDEFKGRPDKVFFEYVAEKLDPHGRSANFYLQEKNDLFIELVREVPIMKGFREFHKKIKSRGILAIMVSSTSIHSFELVDNIHHLSQMFDLIITGADTNEHKPHPEPYIKALEISKLNRDEVIVIEDAPNGIVSAKKAGCFVYGITSSFSRADLHAAGADDVIDSYAELALKLNV